MKGCVPYSSASQLCIVPAHWCPDPLHKKWWHGFGFASDMNDGFSWFLALEMENSV